MPAKWKVTEVEELAKKLKTSPVIAIAGITGLPSKQMAQIRKKLHGQVEIKVVKNSLAHLAFAKVKVSGLDELEKSITGPIALILTQENPFKLAQMFMASRVHAPAKASDIAPFDIIVPAGNTPFKPGPIIGELQGVGIKAKIQGPAIAVIEDSLVIKKGEKFSSKLASVLAQLEITPMELGIELRAALEKGMVYGADALGLSQEKVLEEIGKAYHNALNLAVEAQIFNKVSTPVIIEKAARVAKGVAVEAKIYTEEEALQKLTKAEGVAAPAAASS
jgi:large subunit ribosomal protein L10